MSTSSALESREGTLQRSAIKEPYRSTIAPEARTVSSTATKEYAAAGAQTPARRKSGFVETIRRRRGMVMETEKKRHAVDTARHGCNEWDRASGTTPPRPQKQP